MTSRATILTTLLSIGCSFSAVGAEPPLYAACETALRAQLSEPNGYHRITISHRVDSISAAQAAEDFEMGIWTTPTGEDALWDDHRSVFGGATAWEYVAVLHGWAKDRSGRPEQIDAACRYFSAQRLNVMQVQVRSDDVHLLISPVPQIGCDSPFRPGPRYATFRLVLGCPDE